MTVPRSLSIALTSLLLVCFLQAAEKKATKLDFSGAKWIWHQGTDHAAGSWYFQKGFALPAGQKPTQAKIIITCDNLWTLHVNGKQVGKSDSGRDSWKRPQIIDITKHLVIEENAISVEGVNTIPGPSGLLLKVMVKLGDGTNYEVMSDSSWISTGSPEKSWNENGFTAGDSWSPVVVHGQYGIAPWGKPVVSVGKIPVALKPLPKDKDYPKETEFKEALFRDGIVFVSGFHRVDNAGKFSQFIRGTRAYFEMDAMTPAAIGHQLWSLIPFRPDGKKTLLYDAAGGFIGSPSVSYDGQTVYFSMAKKGEAYFHIYAVKPDGTDLKQVTQGPFHDYDPVELPDGRLAFSSTRLGSREEYHAKYASSIFTCEAEGSTIRPLTYHIVTDREPKVTADGSLVFIRVDNFMERAKVETHLHQTRIDGTAGQVVIGPGRKGVQIDRDAAAEYGMKWLRQYGAGSAAPMPNGQVAAINQKGLVTSAEFTGSPVGGGFLPYDLSPLEDGRLLCTSLRRGKVLIYDPQGNGVKEVVSAEDLELKELHSVVHLGARKRPSARPSMVSEDQDRKLGKTGFLYCQNVLNTQHSAADMKRIKSVRIYEGRPFTLEPTKSIYEHIGTVGVELGTVPLAEDGSFYVEVPADRALAMQAVDGEGRAVINELSWIYTRPGEQRACVGCHAPADAAPSMKPVKALLSKPFKLLGQGDPHRFRANNGANGGIVNLQMDRFREAAAVNLYDVGNDSSLSTVRRLGILRDRASVPVLIKALASKVPEVRCAAAISLSACGNRDAVKPLMAALNDDNPVVAQAVANALEHLTGNPQGGDNWDAIEQSLIQRIKKLPESGSSMASDKSAEDVHLAIEALGHIGGEAGKKALRDYLNKNPNDELRILMAAIRSLGYLKDRDAVPMLTKVMNDNLTKKGKGGHHEFGFGQKPIYLSATAAEALGRIGGSEAETAIITAFPKLNSFEDYVFRTAEHVWLKGVHSSVLHFRMIEALDRMGSKKAGPLVSAMIEAIPADKDRGLLYELDSYEKLTAQVIGQSGRSAEVIEACLHVLADPDASKTFDVTLVKAVSKSPHAQGHIRKHSPQARASQVLSIICDDVKYAERIRALLKKYRAEKPSETRSWCCFMLTRLLGRLQDKDSVELFVEMLEKDPTETALGLNPAPSHNIYKGWRPFYRPAAAWALGQIKDESITDTLLAVVKDLDNASSTREQAAFALGLVGDQSTAKALKTISENYPEMTTRQAILESIEKLNQNTIKH